MPLHHAAQTQSFLAALPQAATSGQAPARGGVAFDALLQQAGQAGLPVKQAAAFATLPVTNGQAAAALVSAGVAPSGKVEMVPPPIAGTHVGGKHAALPAAVAQNAAIITTATAPVPAFALPGPLAPAPAPASPPPQTPAPEGRPAGDTAAGLVRTAAAAVTAVPAGLSGTNGARAGASPAADEHGARPDAPPPVDALAPLPVHVPPGAANTVAAQPAQTERLRPAPSAARAGAPPTRTAIEATHESASLASEPDRGQGASAERQPTSPRVVVKDAAQPVSATTGTAPGRVQTVPVATAPGPAPINGPPAEAVQIVLAHNLAAPGPPAPAQGPATLLAMLTPVAAGVVATPASLAPQPGSASPRPAQAPTSPPSRETVPIGTPAALTVPAPGGAPIPLPPASPILPQAAPAATPLPQAPSPSALARPETRPTRAPGAALHAPGGNPVQAQATQASQSAPAPASSAGEDTPRDEATTPKAAQADGGQAIGRGHDGALGNAEAASTRQGAPPRSGGVVQPSPVRLDAQAHQEQAAAPVQAAAAAQPAPAASATVQAALGVGPAGAASRPTSASPAVKAPLPGAPAAQVAQGLSALHLTGAGARQVTIHLTPGSLGAVQVRIERGLDGAATVTLQVEKAETLHALQQDSAHLHDALDRAGLPAQGRQVSYELAQGQTGGGAAGFGSSSAGQGGAGGGGGSGGQRGWQAGQPQAHTAAPGEAEGPGRFGPAPIRRTATAASGINITA